MTLVVTQTTFYHEILFSTRFSTRFSTKFSTIFENTKKQCISTFLNNYWPNNYSYARQLAILHFKKKIALSIADAFRNHFLPYFYQLLQWMRSAIFEINTNLLVIQKTLIFLHKTLYIPPSFRKKIDTLHLKSFLKHSLFTTISLFSVVSEICNISNKY